MFSVHFPTKPKEHASEGKTIFGTTEVLVASSGSLSAGYYVVQTAHLPASMTATVDDILGTFARSFAQAWQGGAEPVDLRLDQTTHRGVGGLTFTSVVKGPQGIALQTTARLFQYGDAVIAIAVMKPEVRNAPKMLPTRFFDSLDFRPAIRSEATEEEGHPSETSAGQANSAKDVLRPKASPSGE